MARRRRKARPAEGAPATAEERGGGAALRAGYARSAERDAAARARLRPLAPGERPAALVVAAAVAAVLGVGNLVAYAAGMEVEGQRPAAAGVVLLAALLLAAAWGMWARRYWAVLGFEALLGITLAFSALSLLVASNVAAIALCLAVLGLGGWLFWKLIRVMARLQAPQRM